MKSRFHVTAVLVALGALCLAAPVLADDDADQAKASEMMQQAEALLAALPAPDADDSDGDECRTEAEEALRHARSSYEAGRFQRAMERAEDAIQELECD